jgi:hypothetical protein
MATKSGGANARDRQKMKQVRDAQGEFLDYALERPRRFRPDFRNLAQAGFNLRRMERPSRFLSYPIVSGRHDRQHSVDSQERPAGIRVVDVSLCETLWSG